MVRQDIQDMGLTPNKALGQNFLCDEQAVERIAACAAEPGLPVLEIGPGLGALTLPIAQTGLPLAAVELDSCLAEILSRRLEPYPNASVTVGDFLKADLSSLHVSLGGGSITAAGNLPYYITSPVCERLVLSNLPIERMVLMMQKEAGERFFANPGDKNYGPLTVLARYLFQAERLMELSPSAYYPQPEVSSVVLLFNSRGRELPRLMPRLLKCAFAMRRKTLYNNLPAMGVDKPRAAALIERLGLPASVRAEALTVEQFEQLALALEDTSFTS